MKAFTKFKIVLLDVRAQKIVLLNVISLLFWQIVLMNLNGSFNNNNISNF